MCQLLETAHFVSRVPVQSEADRQSATEEQQSTVDSAVFLAQTRTQTNTVVVVVVVVVFSPE